MFVKNLKVSLDMEIEPMPVLAWPTRNTGWASPGPGQAMGVLSPRPWPPLGQAQFGPVGRFGLCWAGLTWKFVHGQTQKFIKKRNNNFATVEKLVIACCCYNVKFNVAAMLNFNVGVQRCILTSLFFPSSSSSINIPPYFSFLYITHSSLYSLLYYKSTTLSFSHSLLLS